MPRPLLSEIQHPRRLLLFGAATFHVIVVALLVLAGLAGVAPSNVDPGGYSPSGDGVLYHVHARWLGAFLRAHGLTAWARLPAPPHVRLLSLAFASFQPILQLVGLGDSLLVIEPVNLALFLAMVAATYEIARELASARVAFAAGWVVAMWPSLLLHSTQPMKDLLFIVCALASVYVVTTLLTRDYDWRTAALATIGAIAMTTVQLTVRPKFAIMLTGIALLGLTLLAVRQVRNRRLYGWNLWSGVVVLIAALTGLVLSTRPVRVQKASPAPSPGLMKDAASRSLPTALVWTTGEDARGRASARSPINAFASRRTDAVEVARQRFDQSNRGAGSGVAEKVALATVGDVAQYLPRAAQIGLWSPFPRMWTERGVEVGRSGRLLAGAETLVVYCCQLLAIAALALPPRRLPALLLAVISTGAVTAMAVIVSNIGTLYRFRYSFWILFIVLGLTGIEKLWLRWRNT